MKEKISAIILILLILLATTEAKSSERVKAEWNQVICIVLRLIQFMAAGIAALVITLAGVKLMTSENLEDRDGARKMLIQAIFGLIIIIIAVQLVNYLVTGSRVERFSLSACDYVPTTTTTIPVTITTTILGATTTTTPGIPTTTTTTSSTTTTIIPCANIDCPNPEATCEVAQMLGTCKDTGGLLDLDAICGEGYGECCCTEWNCCCDPPKPECFL